MHPRPLAVRLLAAALLLAPAGARACACGCGVFTVGTSSLFPGTTGGDTTLFLELDLLDQSRNWSGASSAPAARDPDRDIRTRFYTLGVQHMFDRDWGVMVEVPAWQRHFLTADAGAPTAFDHGALGDVRLLGMYTGISPDLSTGLLYGLKLPTGDWTYRGFDRDTEIGTGTTDLLLGAYQQLELGAAGDWSAFGQAMLDLPLDARQGYRPGEELDAAAGVYHAGWRLARGVALVPVLQALVSWRLHDTGAAADFANSGYRRILAAPGLELDWDRVRLYADLELPVYQFVYGDQLVAPWAAKFTVSYRF